MKPAVRLAQRLPTRLAWSGQGWQQETDIFQSTVRGSSQLVQASSREVHATDLASTASRCVNHPMANLFSAFAPDCHASARLRLVNHADCSASVSAASPHYRRSIADLGLSNMYLRGCECRTVCCFHLDFLGIRSGNFFSLKSAL